MTTPYTELAAKLEALNEKATAWPWCAADELFTDEGSYDEPFIFTKPRTDDTIKVIATMRVGLPERGIDNADLIVTTRNALPTIIAALRDHGRLVEALRSGINTGSHNVNCAFYMGHGRTCDCWKSHFAKLLAEIDGRAK